MSTLPDAIFDAGPKPVPNYPAPGPAPKHAYDERTHATEASKARNALVDRVGSDTIPTSKSKEVCDLDCYW